MRRIDLLAVPLAFALLTAGCAKHWKDGECESDANCVEQSVGKVCVQGRCQECGADTDCSAGFRCADGKCEPRPECEATGDCGPGKACQGGRCVAVAPVPECLDDAQCGAARTCQAGRCVAAPVATPSGESLATCLSDAGPVHFAFDRADLNADARQVLATVNACMGRSPGAVVIEGRCDERGTVEYNLHLGERRAAAVKRYLTRHAGRPISASTKSYGKELPVCTQHDESCWAQNRRADVKPK